MFSPSLFGFSGFLPQSPTLSYLGVWCECECGWLFVCPVINRVLVTFTLRLLGATTLSAGEAAIKNSMDSYLTAFCAYLPKCMISI